MSREEEIHIQLTLTSALLTYITVHKKKGGRGKKRASDWKQHNRQAHQ